MATRYPCCRKTWITTESSTGITLDNRFLLLLAGAYLLGSIPFGLIFTRLFTGRNLRDLGSGNIGATNAMRSGGRGIGLMTLIADLGKGLLPVLIALQLFPGDEMRVAPVAAAAFYGHIFPLFLVFRGGKGVATMFGVILPWMPWVACAAFIIWGITLTISRYVSLASILSALMLPLAALLFNAGMVATATLALLSITIIARHAGNIQRLRDGTESRIGSTS